MHQCQPLKIFSGKAGARVNIDKSLLRETQSCELLVSVNNGKNVKHDIVRKTVSVASAARIKDDTNILRNIKKREVVNALKGNTKSLSLGGLSGLSKAGLSSKLNFTMSVSDKYEPSWKDSQFISELLDWHNLLRARHGVKQLQLDNSLCKMAQNWANFLAHTNEFHYQNPKEVKYFLINARSFFGSILVWREFATLAIASIATFIIGQEVSGCDRQICCHLLVPQSFLISLSC